MTNTEKTDLDRRLKALDPNYKLYESQSSRGVWRMLKVSLVLTAIAGLSFVSLGVANAYLLLLLWPIPLLFTFGYYSAALSSLVGIFIFKSGRRKILAICVFFAWLVSFVAQLIF
jgi:hypothetical protein